MQWIDGRFAGSAVACHAEGGWVFALTCRHLETSNNPHYWPERCQAVFADGRAVNAVLVAKDSAADLAAIAWQGTDAVVPIATTPSEPGTRIYQWGFGGNQLQFRYGAYVRALSVTEFQFSVAPTGGDSGSGIFRDSDGHLVALVRTRDDEGGGRILAGATGRVALTRFVQETCRQWLRQRQDAPRPRPEPGPTPPAAPDYTPVLEAIAALNRRLDKIERTPGPPGPPGKDGLDGKDGKDADTGPLLLKIDALQLRLAQLEEAQATKLQLDALRADVARLRETIQHLSGSIRIRLEPVPVPK